MPGHFTSEDLSLTKENHLVMLPRGSVVQFPKKILRFPIVEYRPEIFRDSMMRQKIHS